MADEYYIRKCECNPGSCDHLGDDLFDKLKKIGLPLENRNFLIPVFEESLIRLKLYEEDVTSPKGEDQENIRGLVMRIIKFPEYIDLPDDLCRFLQENDFEPYVPKDPPRNT